MRYFFTIIISAVLLLACKGKKTQAFIDPDVYYTCSMDPQVRENRPGKCPICKMELTAVRKSNRQNTDEIELSAQQVQLGNIHVDTLGKRTIGNEVTLNATLNFDQLKTNAMSAKVGGRIQILYFKNIGDYVPKGAKLYELSSEELNNAKQEYLLALEKQKTLDNSIIDFDQLIQGAKNKLLLWGMSGSQIEELAINQKASPLTSFYNNSAGVITSLEVGEGGYVTEGTTIVRLADLSTLWAEAQVYSSQLSTIDRNGQATVQFPGIPEAIKGKIEFLNPEINPDTRINLIRVVVPNANHQLKPGMPAYVTIKNQEFNTLSLPADAVIRESRGASVWIETGINKFKYKMVEVGLESNDRIEIKSGLKAGDIIVISGAYLLNSEYIFKQGANPMEGMDRSKMKLQD
ncbi:MAG TPA: efflux RND transporter periplasmic adaptor subunit [Puia sp.]|nr:efflux RND transporter periplasmic adaptor subunit [Puia sp.]